MIHFIRGKLAILNPGSIVIENNGIGYGLTVPENSSFFPCQGRGGGLRLYLDDCPGG
jgi:Holliday junction resolvasome, DNA-binding subunit